MSNNFIHSLLIDTSSKRSIISINCNEKPVAFSFFAEESVSSWLFPSIKELLEKNNLLPKDIDFISLGRGPGSYTGIRVGAAVAKSLAYSLDIPLIDFCSLKSFIPPTDGLFFSLFDAKSGGIYLLEGIKNHQSVIYKTKPLLIPIEEASRYLSKTHSIASPHVETLKERLLSLIDSEKWFDAFPNISHLAKISFYKYTNKNFTLSDKLQLLYLRGPKPIAL